jgi:hypothetical protein
MRRTARASVVTTEVSTPQIVAARSVAVTVEPMLKLRLPGMWSLRMSTELIVLPCPRAFARPVVCADAQGRASRRRILHRPGQQLKPNSASHCRRWFRGCAMASLPSRPAT